MRPFLLILVACAACARPAFAPLAPAAFPFAVDSVHTDLVRPGVAHRTIWSPAGPWVIHALDVRLDQCWTAVAVKGAPGAVRSESVV